MAGLAAPGAMEGFVDTFDIGLSQPGIDYSLPTQVLVIQKSVREVHLTVVEPPAGSVARPLPNVTLFELLDAFKQVLERAALYRHHRIRLEPLSVRERMTTILSRVSSEQFLSFESLFDVTEGRMGLVVSFLAVLELLKEALIVIVQHEPFAPIHVKAA